MKQYNNGPRKGMMYGGMSRRKPMMYGGTAMKKPRKKAYGGGMMSSSQPQQNMMQNNNMTSGDMNQMQTAMMQTPKMRMAFGGKAMLGDLDEDGKMSGYEKKRQAAIQKNMKKSKKA
jgi:hypothetical protein